MPEMLSKEEIFKIWSPPGGLWSPWVKPVLFARINGIPPTIELSPFTGDLSWVPVIETKTALVLDLPREEGVMLGMEFAARGYRPILLYNAMPHPTPEEIARIEGLHMFEPVVDVAPIRYALWHMTGKLQSLALAPDAPPVFLLDANRRVGRWAPTTGNFDNRSVSFTTDFPSAIFLQSHGISRALLVQHTALQPQPDLAHTLRRWQDAGLAIELKALDMPGIPAPCEVAKPSRFGAIWYRVLQTIGLQRHSLGGYGGIIGLSSGG